MKSVVLVLFLAALVIADKVAPLLHADSPDVIPNSYIVVLNDNTHVLDRDAHILALQDIIRASDADAEVVFTYNIGSFVGFSARLTPDLLKAQLAHPLVKYIEANQRVSINYEQESKVVSPLAVITQTGATWGLDRIDQRYLPLQNNYAYDSTAGKGVNVYVLDTGILTTHVDFGGRASSVFNAITNEANTDLNGHGTHCAGTIGGTVYGVAKQVSLFAVKVLSASGSGSYEGVVAGVDYVTNIYDTTVPTIASMSLGGGPSTALDSAIVNSIGKGVSYAIAAGNSNANACNYSPARVTDAVTVGATTRTDARASYSNIGTCVDIFAPGSDITSDWIGSNTATNTISGTSMATPHVAGIMAQHLSINGVNEAPSVTKSWLVSTATANVVTGPGTGSPNLLAFSPNGEN